MIIDALNEYADELAVTVTANFTNVVDHGPFGYDEDSPLALVIQVDEAATASGAATVEFILQTDDNSGFTSAKQLYSSGAISKDALTLGAKPVAIRLPGGSERYTRVRAVVTTGPLTAGKFSAFLVNTDQASLALPNQI